MEGQQLTFKFNRVFAHANPLTFQIPPIAELISRYFNPNDFWIDPFANENSPAQATNDLNNNFKTSYNLEFLDFFDLAIEKWKNIVYGTFIDPPYSPRQISESYKNIGKKWVQVNGTQGGFYSASWKKIIELNPQLVIQCGWHTNGNTQHYEIIEELQVYHGSQHNDTLVTVWKKKNHSLEDFL